MTPQSPRVHRKLTWAALALIPVLVLALSYLLAKEFQRSGAQRQNVEQSFQARTDILTTFSLLQDIETGQRGYLLTGEDSFLEPARRGSAALPAELAKLKSGLADDGNQALLARLDELVREKLAFADRTVALHASGRLSDSKVMMDSRHGKETMDEIRLVLGELDARERADLAQSIDSAAKARAQTKRVAFGLHGVLGLLLIITTLSTKRNRDAFVNVARRQQAIFDATNDGMVVHDSEGRIESTNPAVAAMHGYAPKEMVGQHLSLLMGDTAEDEEFHAQLMQTRRATDRGFSVQRLARRKDGSTFPVEVMTSPVHLAEGLRFIGIFRDVTERQRVHQMKNEFVSTVSHELRTPLTSIAGSLGLLTGGAGGPLPDRAARLIKIAHTNSERLVRLINDILDIEKIESGRMRFDIKPIPLRPLLEHSIQSNQAFASQFDVSVELDDEAAPDAVVLADPDRLTQVMVNLLSNAAKFAPGTTVHVRVTPAGEDRLSICVEDHGAGIPVSFRDQIFSKFAQADNSDTRSKGGTGLGLSIVKEIVTRLNGSIHFESQPGEGTRFFVEIPSAGRSNETPGVKPSLVLLCEEGGDGSRRVKDALGAAGFDCDVAADTAELKSLMAFKNYAVLILDLPLPGDDVVDLIRDLRRAPRHQLTPILVVSSAPDQGEISQALDIADWIDKPDELDRVVLAVRKVLAGRPDAPRILHIEDDPDVVGVVATAFEGRANVTAAKDIAEARASLASGNFDLVILDLALPDGSGAELLADIRGADGQPIPVVIFSACESGPELSRRVEASLTKSHASLGHLVKTVEMLVERFARTKGREMVRS